MSATPLPETFGRFRVLRPLGQGGMGSVYLAKDTLLERQVAVKVPLVDKQANPHVIARFLREAKAAASIDHPNVCPVFEVGEHGNGYYLVMPFLEGTPLHHLVGGGRPWEPDRALELMAKLAGGVQAIHDKGLIHRDLKPANVLLRGDEPVLLDLGLARSLADEGQSLTRTGQPVGTPAYMAPEQLAGVSKRLGPATDVYALGVILYELLTGQLPFVGPLHVLYAQILHSIPRPPSAVRPELDWADALCGQALAKQPQDRLASAEELARALGACRQTLGERATPSAPDDRPEQPPEAKDTYTVPRSPGASPGSGSRTLPPPLPTALPSPERQTQWAFTQAPAETVVSRGGVGRSTRRRRRKQGGAGWVAALVGVLVLAGLLGWIAWRIALLLGPPAASSGRPPELVGSQQPGPGEGEPKTPPPDTKPLPPEITNSIGMKLVLVPRGKFLMGSPTTEPERNDDERQHEVEISKPFYLGAFEVTQAQYQQVMGANPSRFTKDNGGGPDHPVEKVSWYEAVEFCKKLSALEKERSSGRIYRLPSEAEWEYACREAGKSQTPYHFGNTLSSDQANFNGNVSHTTKVGSYNHNGSGIYDMHGNVAEWCADWYDPAYYTKSPRKDPTGPATATGHRVLRGGSWDNSGPACRAAYRGRFDPGYRIDNFGFRVVCVPAGAR
jgi:formylglycine-generating enzyme required for sulfatase activity/serine/threonine protein kinase